MDAYSPKTVFAALQADPYAHLIDCRTKAEWMLGYPDLTCLQRTALFIEWQDAFGQKNPDFIHQTMQYAQKEQQIFVICRSGIRSAAACMSLSAHGFRHVANVAEGFEGDLNAQNQRGKVNGWKFHRLPHHIP